MWWVFELQQRYASLATASRPRVTGPGGDRPYGESMLTIILIVLLIVALGGGGWGYSRWGAAGWSPAGLILLVLLIMLLTGNLHW